MKTYNHIPLEYLLGFPLNLEVLQVFKYYYDYIILKNLAGLLD